VGVVITGIEQGSIAHRLGINPGWILTRIDGHEIEDVFDYRFYMAAKNLTLEFLTPDARPFSLPVEKDEYEDLGFSFSSYLMDMQKNCRNRCIFCFIDQLPQGLRESLYFKDDDERMSFLFGNYVTLTNLRERDIERIIEFRLSPVNISVHATNPSLRAKIMGNEDAGSVLKWIDRLAKGGVRLNAQLVLCPGINDGKELERSLRDLIGLAPMMQSIAIVPVGLTKHRQGLTELRPFTKSEASAALDAVDAFGDEMLAKHGQRICYASDEFYLLAGRDFPPASYYGAFDQLENGIGMCALFASEFSDALRDAPYLESPKNISIATGVAAAPFISSLISQAKEFFPNLNAAVFPIENDFLGNTITVSGLVTGKDLIRRLEGKDLGEALLIPGSMLRREGDLFLDGLSPDDVRQALNIPVIPIENNGEALLAALRPI